MPLRGSRARELECRLCRDGGGSGSAAQQRVCARPQARNVSRKVTWVVARRRTEIGVSQYGSRLAHELSALTEESIPASTYFVEMLCKLLVRREVGDVWLPLMFWALF
jgi:hypothetical protein